MIKACLDNRGKNCQGAELELGCGVTPMSDHYPNILSTDIEETECTSTVLDACNLGNQKQKYSAIYGVNCFHHISEKKKFFEQAGMALEPGGVVILLEPADTVFSRILYPHLFKIESYDTRASIDSLRTEDPVKGANQAASFICFKRDQSEFMKDLEFDLVQTVYLRNWLSFILCGGTNFPELAPYRLIRWLENKDLLTRVFALHWINVFRKW